MTRSEIENIILAGEKREVELKETKNKLPKYLWETYSAFSNSKGRYYNFRNKRKQ